MTSFISQFKYNVNWQLDSQELDFRAVKQVKNINHDWKFSLFISFRSVLWSRKLAEMDDMIASLDVCACVNHRQPSQERKWTSNQQIRQNGMPKRTTGCNTRDRPAWNPCCWTPKPKILTSSKDRRYSVNPRWCRQNFTTDT